MRGVDFMNAKDMTVEQLKNAIWNYNNGIVPMLGLPIEEYRNALFFKNGETKGYHEEEPK